LKIVFKITPIIILIFLSLVFVEKCLQLNFIQDDAYTSFRYARNLAEGNGLVFNVTERVEGYTNFLWVIILSMAYKFNLNLEIFSQLLSTVFGILTIWLMYYFSSYMFKPFIQEYNWNGFIKILYSLLPSLLLTFSAPLIYWSVSGMETSLFIFLTTLSVFLFFESDLLNKKRHSIIIVSVLNMLTRPEGLVIFSLLISFSLLKKFISNESSRISERLKTSFDRNIRHTLLFFSIPVITYYIFRFHYYGYFFPNTFYAKTNFSVEYLIRGLDYLIEFAESNLLFGVILLLPFLNLIQKSFSNKIIFFYYFIILYFLLIVIIGGDVLPIHRFFLPILPLIFIFSVLGLSQLTRISTLLNNKVLSIIIIFVIIFYALENFSQQKNSIIVKRSYEAGLVKKMKIYGNWIKNKQESNKEKFTVALSTIGAFSYVSNAKVIDLVGLTDEYIAHNPKEVDGINDELPIIWKERVYNAEYVLSRKPDYIIFPSGAKPSAFAECALFVQSDFYKNYYMQLIYSQELNQLLPIFTKRETPINITSNRCDVKFIKYFIEANNLLLKLIETSNTKFLEHIINKTKISKVMCPQRISDIILIKGMALYHSNKKVEAELELLKCIEVDPMNMASRFYLQKIYNDRQDYQKMIIQLKWLKRYSPSVVPNLVSS
jgi:hypothetical protein